MSKIKSLILVPFSLLFLFSSNAQQVPLKSVVEHFTNTKCGVCANNNPSLFSNYNNTSNILYLSVHPSSPYSSCFLSQQNRIVNDARTNYYGIYGGTPRIVLNGNVYSGSFSNSSLFSPYQNLTSSFIINSKTEIVNDSIIVYTIIKKADTSSQTNAILFIGLVEDTINQNGGNGENKHYNVLRNATTESITLPANVNDSIIKIQKFSKNNVWQFNRIKGFIMLQKSDNKKLIQAEMSKQSQSPNTSINNANISKITFYPNPASKTLFLNDNSFENIDYQIISLDGKLIKFGQVENNQINISDVQNGSYIIKMKNVNNTFQNLLLIEN